jgi:beta-glucanase (GH16 family)
MSSARLFPLLLAMAPLASRAEPPPVTGMHWKQTFADEFSGSAVDASKWQSKYRFNAVINDEKQAYVADAFRFEGGNLRVMAEKRAATYAGKAMQYTSGVLISADRFSQKFGYFEMKAKLPKGKGLWPAFWLQPQNDDGHVHELDIMEYLGHEVNTVYFTGHWGTDYGAGHKMLGGNFKGADYSAEFHIFGLEWNAAKVTWYIDGVERFALTDPAGIPQIPMYILINLAVGGGWPGDPDAGTVFPNSYDLEYVRAYALEAGLVFW